MDCMIRNLSAAVLVGGLGTRLRPLTYNVPKPLVEVEGKPFIDYVLSELAKMGVKRAVLLTGYKHAMVKRHCGSGKRYGLRIEYCREKRRMGTGGAILAARGMLKTTTLVANGDSFLELPLSRFLALHRKKGALATVFSMKGSLKARGAIVAGKNGQVLEFLEKQKGGRGIFNTGAYLVEPSALTLLCSHRKRMKHPMSFSMEHEGFPFLLKTGKMYTYTGKGKFLDMGTFESLAKAGKILPMAKKG